MTNTSQLIAANYCKVSNKLSDKEAKAINLCYWLDHTTITFLSHKRIMGVTLYSLFYSFNIFTLAD